MKDEKRNPIGYWTATRMEEEQQHAEETEAAGESHSTQEQAAQEHFETGGWQQDAEETVNDEERMNDLLDKEEEFTNKKGLSRIRKQLMLLWDYVKAVTSGDYTDYSMWAYLKIVAGLLYVVSPLDLIPDFFPWVGWADDIAVIIFIVGDQVKDELATFANWKKQKQAA